MANLTAVTGNWTATAATNTAFGGASTTAAADEITIPNGVTVTIITGVIVFARSVTIATGGTLVFATTSSQLNIGDATAGTGNVAFSNSGTITLTGIGLIQIVSTNATQQTIKTNSPTAGSTMPSTTIVGLGGSFLLSDNFTTTGTLSHTAGTFNTNNKTISCSIFSPSSGSTRTLTLGSSSITCTVSSTNAITNTTVTNQTITANTATITCTGSTANIVLGNTNWNGTSVVVSGTGAGFFTGGTSCTIANLTRTGAADKLSGWVMTNGTSVTVTGTLTLTGNSVTNRLYVSSQTIGTSAVVSAASVSLTNVDLMDVLLTGNVGAISTSDSFNRANGSLNGSTTDIAYGGSGLVWGTPTQAGTWSISSNQLAPNYSPTGAVSVEPLPVGLADVRVSFVVKVLPNTGNGVLGLVVRYLDANNFIYLSINQSGNVNIGTCTAGTYSANSIANAVTTGLIAGDTVGLEVNGYAVVLYKNGTVFSLYALTVTQFSSMTGTGVGIAATNTIVAQCDDFKVWPMSPWSGTSLGDCLGNSGVTFAASVTQTNTGVTGNWSDATKWTSRVPLPQDDVIISSGSGNITLDMPRIGRDVTWTGFSGTATYTTSLAQTSYGSMTFASGMSFALGNTVNITLAGRGTHTFTSAGKNFGFVNGGLVFTGFGGIYTLQDTVTINTGGFTHSAGTLVTNNVTLNIAVFTCQGAITRTLTLGTSIINLNVTSSAWTVVTTGLTISAASSTINFTIATGTTRAFAGGGATYGTVNYSVANSTGTLTISGANYIETLTLAAARAITLQTSTMLTVRNLTGTGVNNGYVYFNNSSGVYMSAPDSAALSITGNLDIRVRVALDDWTPSIEQRFVSKWVASTANRSYIFGVTPAGNLTLALTTNGSTSVVTSSTVTAGLTDGTAYWVRATYETSTRNIKFYTAPDNVNVPSGAGWTQLGSTQAAAGPVSIFDSIALLNLGASDIGTISNIAGKLYRVQIINNILDNGTGIQFDANLATKTWGANTFTESSSNAATVTVIGGAQAGDGRLQITSATSGTVAYLALVGPVNTFDYHVIQDINSTIPYKYYAGVNSSLVSGTTAVIATAAITQPYMVQQVETTGTTAVTTATLSFSKTTTAGNLLLVFYGQNAVPASVTTPTDYTLIDTQNLSTTNLSKTYYKIADGTETGVAITASASSSSTYISFVEVAGWTGTPTLDVSDKNSGTAVTTLASNGSNPSNTSQPAYAVAWWGGSSTLGATVSITNSFHQARIAAEATIWRTFAKPLLTTAAVNSTYTWTTNRSAVSQLVVFKDTALIAAGHMLSLMGVGT